MINICNMFAYQVLFAFRLLQLFDPFDQQPFVNRFFLFHPGILLLAVL